MKPESEQAPQAQPPIERRAHQRFFARAKATIIRDSDAMRNGMAATLVDLSTCGLGLSVSGVPPDLDEVIEVLLINEVQRFSRKVRGIVRHVTSLPDGECRVGVELMTRLTPLEVSLLKITSFGKQENDSPEWF